MCTTYGTVGMRSIKYTGLFTPDFKASLSKVAS